MLKIVTRLVGSNTANKREAKLRMKDLHGLYARLASLCVAEKIFSASPQHVLSLSSGGPALSPRVGGRTAHDDLPLAQQTHIKQRVGKFLQTEPWIFLPHLPKRGGDGKRPIVFTEQNAEKLLLGRFYAPRELVLADASRLFDSFSGAGAGAGGVCSDGACAVALHYSRVRVLGHYYAGRSLVDVGMSGGRTVPRLP